MASLIAQHTTYIGQTSSSLRAVCKTRTDLLNRLAGLLVELGRAKLQLTTAVESGDTVQFESAQFEVERLRNDCNGLKAELEYHRARHG